MSTVRERALSTMFQHTYVGARTTLRSKSRMPPTALELPWYPTAHLHRPLTLTLRSNASSLYGFNKAVSSYSTRYSFSYLYT